MKNNFFILMLFIVSTNIFCSQTYLDLGLSYTKMKDITEINISNDIEKRGICISITHYFVPLKKIGTDIGVGLSYANGVDRKVYSTKDYRYEGFNFDNVPLFLSFKTKVYEKNKFKFSLKNNIGYSFNIGEDDYTIDKRYEKNIDITEDFYIVVDEWKRYDSKDLDVKNGIHYSISAMGEYEGIQGGLFYTVNKAEGDLEGRKISLDRDIYGVFVGVNF